MQNGTVNSTLTQYLLSLGFLPKYSGFIYIKQCVEYVIDHNCILCSLSKTIYPYVADHNATTAINIERNIRNSIKCAKQFCLDNGIKDNIFFQINKISNKTMIGYLVDQIMNSVMEMNQVV